jgi:sigma-E factor negative regulatory protein RseC
MIEHGQVIGAGPGSVDVRMGAGTDACAKCSHCTRVDKEGLVISDVRDDIGVKVGDTVEVEIPEDADLRAGVIVYVLPVIALLVGYGVGRALAGYLGWDADATGAVFALIGVAGGMMFMRSRARRMLASERFRPRVRAIMARTLDSRSAAAGRTQ